MWISTNAGLQANARWLNQGGPAGALFRSGEQWLAGDFNGDGAFDIVGVYGDTSSAVAMDGFASAIFGFSTLFSTMQPWMRYGWPYWSTQQFIAGRFGSDCASYLNYCKPLWAVTNLFADGSGLATADVYMPQ